MAVSGRFSFAVILVWLLGPCLCYADQHPPIEAGSNCLDCHADHAAGVHVHPAVKRGCTSCHRVEERENVTYVVLKSEKSIVCQECHQPETLTHAHFPYASGMCLRCHNPHGSANPRLLRAKVNDLCLQCHLRTPDTVPSRYLPTIALSMNDSMGHPYERHPVSGSLDPLTGGEMSCVSCHMAHGGTKQHYLKMAAEIPEDALNENTETKDMCRKCHLRMWGLEGVGAGKKNKRTRAK
jgi:predicted CXXCH cytochrome family protein